MKPRVFIGSSSEAAEHVAPVIQSELSQVASAQIWNQSFFPPGTYVLDVLAEKAATFDFAILVFAADDVVESRGKRFLAARDNTVLEAGYFLAELGRLRTFIVAPDADGLKIPSDMSGLSWIPYPGNLDPDLIRAELGPSCFTLRTRIQQLGARSRPETQLSEGMTVVLGLLSATRVTLPIRVQELLARFNGDASFAHPGWEKSTQYLLWSLSNHGLVELSKVDSFGGFQLTTRGRSHTQSPQFKFALKRIQMSDRGARIADILPPP
jgi:hypothetical protein